MGERTPQPAPLRSLIGRDVNPVGGRILTGIAVVLTLVIAGPRVVLPNEWGVCVGPVHYGFCEQGQGRFLRSIADDQAWQQYLLAAQFANGDPKEMYYWALKLSFAPLPRPLMQLARAATLEAAGHPGWLGWLDAQGRPSEPERHGAFAALDLYAYVAKHGAGAKIVHAWSTHWERVFLLGAQCVDELGVGTHCAQLEAMLPAS